MLNEITLQNFKCFNNNVIPFRPITIVVGRNNAGKSTIIEALRLVSLVANRWSICPYTKFHGGLIFPA
jgi:AAA15 family ATPase/GTPase